VKNIIHAIKQQFFQCDVQLLAAFSKGQVRPWINSPGQLGSVAKIYAEAEIKSAWLQPFTNQMLCLHERLERFLPDHSITRWLVNRLRAGIHY
jgi:hypothetical protein